MVLFAKEKKTNFFYQKRNRFSFCQQETPPDVTYSWNGNFSAAPQFALLLTAIVFYMGKLKENNPHASLKETCWFFMLTKCSELTQTHTGSLINLGVVPRWKCQQPWKIQQHGMWGKNKSSNKQKHKRLKVQQKQKLGIRKIAKIFSKPKSCVFFQGKYQWIDWFSLKKKSHLVLVIDKDKLMAGLYYKTKPVFFPIYFPLLYLLADIEKEWASPVKMVIKFCLSFENVNAVCERMLSDLWLNFGERHVCFARKLI